MHIETDGLVIGERSIGESDRLVTVLTREEGLLRAFARQANRFRSQKLFGTQLLCYSRFQIYRGRDAYIIDEAQAQELFFDLRRDIDRLSLAQYFCELASVLAPQEAPAGDFLRLLLNALHYLSRGNRPLLILKAVVEMRSLSLAGFMPDLVACRRCGRYEGPEMWFYPREGVISCPECGRREPLHSPYRALPPGVLMALRHTIYADLEKLFGFSLSAGGQKLLAKASEEYTLSTLERGFKTLDFFHDVYLEPEEPREPQKPEENTVNRE